MKKQRKKKKDVVVMKMENIFSNSEVEFFAWFVLEKMFYTRIVYVSQSCT